MTVASALSATYPKHPKPSMTVWMSWISTASGADFGAIMGSYADLMGCSLMRCGGTPKQMPEEAKDRRPQRRRDQRNCPDRLRLGWRCRGRRRGFRSSLLLE